MKRKETSKEGSATASTLARLRRQGGHAEEGPVTGGGGCGGGGGEGERERERERERRGGKKERILGDNPVSFPANHQVDRVGRLFHGIVASLRDVTIEGMYGGQRASGLLGAPAVLSVVVRVGADG